MSRLFSPDYRPPASYNPMQSSRSKTGSGADEEKPLPPRFNPRTKLYDREGNLTGRQIGAGSKEMRRLDMHGRPTGKLELGSLDAERRARGGPNPFEARLSRTDRIAQARADGTFDAKRNAFNAASTGSVMDERGEIGPRAPGTATQGGGTTAGQQPKPGRTPVSDLAAPFLNLPGAMGSFARTAAQVGDRVMQPGGVKQPPAPAAAPESTSKPSTGGRLVEWSGGHRWVPDSKWEEWRKQEAGAREAANKVAPGSQRMASNQIPSRTARIPLPSPTDAATQINDNVMKSVGQLESKYPRTFSEWRRQTGNGNNALPYRPGFGPKANGQGAPGQAPAMPPSAGAAPGMSPARAGGERTYASPAPLPANGGGGAGPQAATLASAPAGGGGLAAASEPINLSGGGGGISGGGGGGGISLGGGGGLGGTIKKKAAV